MKGAKHRSLRLQFQCKAIKVLPACHQCARKENTEIAVFISMSGKAKAGHMLLTPAFVAGLACTQGSK
jgi:hypothetical protein